jgi:hypothetical protein
MSEFDAMMGCIGFLFIGLMVGYWRGWVDSFKKVWDNMPEIYDEWREADD